MVDKLRKENLGSYSKDRDKFVTGFQMLAEAFDLSWLIIHFIFVAYFATIVNGLIFIVTRRGQLD